ncbi:hypothetical protein PsYK624_165330 [Phanerochaete sordida]|uniref:Uncharacterized protein n=1 Tax=Phanerochaete sordida TaxID=48140 RepID=A0A9P3GR24_9APHY|nr:hypothetical protein PsYK624_165330 [Phanerochaete sordida]
MYAPGAPYQYPSELPFAEAEAIARNAAFRSKLGLPTAFQRWFKMWVLEGEAAGHPQSYLDTEDVRVFLQVDLEKASPHEKSNVFTPVLSKYTLWVYCYISPEVPVTHHDRVSPRAILDEHIGSNQDLDAPEWTRWSPEAGPRQIRKRRDNMADLFINLAFQHANLVQHKLSVEMIEWAVIATAELSTSRAAEVKQRAACYGFASVTSRTNVMHHRNIPTDTTM